MHSVVTWPPATFFHTGKHLSCLCHGNECTMYSGNRYRYRGGTHRGHQHPLISVSAMYCLIICPLAPSCSQGLPSPGPFHKQLLGSLLSGRSVMQRMAPITTRVYRHPLCHHPYDMERTCPKRAQPQVLLTPVSWLLLTSTGCSAAIPDTTCGQEWRCSWKKRDLFFLIQYNNMIV